tara:strand:- start:394 stop:582 length:189 start_codon:yes stop_codon:yes gene_type:complete
MKNNKFFQQNEDNGSNAYGKKLTSGQMRHKQHRETALQISQDSDCGAPPKKEPQPSIQSSGR